MKIFAMVFLVFCGGCSLSEDSGLNTVPITNNPNIVPNHGGMPGFGAPSNGPY